jgi:hypothetical protein
MNSVQIVTILIVSSPLITANNQKLTIFVKVLAMTYVPQERIKSTNC